MEPLLEPIFQDLELPDICNVGDCDGVYPQIGPALQDIFSSSYCDLPVNEYEACPDIDEPVCADYYGPTDYYPDYSAYPDSSASPDYYNYDAVLRQTYASACSACNDRSVISYRYGPYEDVEEWERFIEGDIWY